MSLNLSNQVYVLFPYLCSDYVSLQSDDDDESLSLFPPPMSPLTPQDKRQANRVFVSDTFKFSLIQTTIIVCNC